MLRLLHTTTYLSLTKPMTIKIIAVFITGLLISVIGVTMLEKGGILPRSEGDIVTPTNKSSTSGDGEYVVISDDLIPGNTLVKSVDVNTGTLLSTVEREGLIFMREEEKLARDVYLDLYDIYGAQIFKNIASSEQTHTDAAKELLERYGIEDPVTDDSRGVFADETLDNLYTELIARGKTSALEAFKVGAYIEDLDIIDLQKQIALTERADILAVYAHLERGSRNHLRAFNRQIENQSGASYVPEFLSQVAFDTIIDADTERGVMKAQRDQRGGQREIR